MVQCHMIRTFRSRALKRLHERDVRTGISAEQLPRVRTVLAILDDAAQPSDLDLPGYRLHSLRGDLRGFWSVRISGNYRLIFRMEDGDAYDVDLLDYH